MSDSEVNRLKTGAFTFRFETLPPSSSQSHLTILVSHLSSHDKLNIHCLFTFLLKDRDRLTNKSLVCIFLFVLSRVLNLLIENVNNISLPTRNKVSQREKKVIAYKKMCNPYFYSFCQDTIRLG